ncbi:aldehyde dehydrogenase family protein, partial [Actinomadura napierensis]|uniref:aldehyde dehydrogenase family protein n=1 Tax=Actinomadura napierensis TaxID=267854 RepID=UPI0031D5B767
MRRGDRWTLAGGRWSRGGGDGAFTVTDPATGDPVGEVPVGTAVDVAAAVAGATRAAPGWAATAPA